MAAQLQPRHAELGGAEWYVHRAGRPLRKRDVSGAAGSGPAACGSARGPTCRSQPASLIEARQTARPSGSGIYRRPPRGPRRACRRDHRRCLDGPIYGRSDREIQGDREDVSNRGSYANSSTLEIVMRAASRCRWLIRTFLSSASAIGTMTDGTRSRHAETRSSQALPIDRVTR